VKHARRLASAAALAAAYLAAPPAQANGRYPAANQLVVAPTDPRLLVLRLTFGLLVSRDAGVTWDWVCEDAVGYGQAGMDEDPAIGVTGSAAILVGTEEGLFVSPDTGCAWSPVPAINQWAIDVSVRRDSPSSALALSRSFFGNVGDGGNSTYSPALFLTLDNGATWAPYGAPIDPLVAPETVDVAPSDHRRVYVSGFRVMAGIPQGILLSSADDGMTWTPHDVPIDPLADIDVLVGGVDPTNPDRVYLRVVQTTGSRLVVSDDGGNTFRTVETTNVGMPGFAISPDGSKVYLGGDDGIRVASAATLDFTLVSSLPVQCLATSGTTLYACASENNGFVLGASIDDGATFTPILHMCDIRGLLSCAADTAEAVCTSEWPLTRETIAPDAGPTGCPSPQDAGDEAGDASGSGEAGDHVDAGDAGEPADSSSEAGSAGGRHDGGCGCAVVSGKGTVAAAFLGPLGLLLALRARKRARAGGGRTSPARGRREVGRASRG
jgi:hypothetical protein